MMKWTEALKKAPYALPARLCLAALLVSAINWIVSGNNYMSAGSLNWRMSDLVLLFLIGSATFFPVSYLSAARIQAEHPPLSARRRYILMFGSLVVAIIVSTVIRLITV
ncbi:hypothetical protein HHL24_11310 [Paraburkholderia sp. RP-4-7]|uniref:Uncharacterized protein n=1 Tax=Paraburkholderia polaris TaxID=2728848 RepID=A0A848IAG2_9BURK|nr:hypothetical protein [Paraburkholderia polaris]NML98540.1 hypothetical protein [Paraburkholderia polaris]